MCRLPSMLYNGKFLRILVYTLQTFKGTWTELYNKLLPPFSTTQLNHRNLYGVIPVEGGLTANLVIHISRMIKKATIAKYMMFVIMCNSPCYLHQIGNTSILAIVYNLVMKPRFTIDVLLCSCCLNGILSASRTHESYSSLNMLVILESLEKTTRTVVSNMKRDRFIAITWTVDVSYDKCMWQTT